MELLSGPDVNESNWGSTYWTSPQSDWSWPPVPAVDTLPYAVTVDGASVILVSGQANVGSQVGGKNVTVTKRFTANVALEAIDVEYTLTNVGATAITIASWEISRVPGGGLTFYPTGTGAPEGRRSRVSRQLRIATRATPTTTPPSVPWVSPRPNPTSTGSNSGSRPSRIPDCKPTDGYTQCSTAH